MKTMIEIDDTTLNEIIRLTGAKNNNEAVLAAINAYLKMKKRETLKSLIGNYDIDLDLKTLEKTRREN